jgi:hypothetical protein
MSINMTSKHNVLVTYRLERVAFRKTTVFKLLMKKN